MGRKPQNREKDRPKKLEVSGVNNSQGKNRIVRAPSPDITAFRTSRRPKNPIVFVKDQLLDVQVLSPQIALEPETYDVPPRDALAASIDLEISKGSYLDDVVNSSAGLLSLDLTYLDVDDGHISPLGEDPQLELFGALPNVNNHSDVSREFLSCVANGAKNSQGDGQKDGRTHSVYSESDGSSEGENESYAGSSTGDLTTEESDEEEHIVGLDSLQNPGPPRSENTCDLKTSTFAEAETVSINSSDGEQQSEPSPRKFSTDTDCIENLVSTNSPSAETDCIEKLTSTNSPSADADCIEKLTSTNSPSADADRVENLASTNSPGPEVEKGTSKTSHCNNSSDTCHTKNPYLIPMQSSDSSSRNSASTLHKDKSRSPSSSPQKLPSAESNHSRPTRKGSSKPSHDECPTSHSDLLSPDFNPTNLSSTMPSTTKSSPVSSMEDLPDSSLPQAPRPPDEFDSSNPSTNFSENFAESMSLSTLISFGSTLCLSKQSVSNEVTFKQELPMEGESDPFADMGISLSDLAPEFPAPDIPAVVTATTVLPSSSPDVLQSFSAPLRRSCSIGSQDENNLNIPIQSSKLSTSSSSLLLNNLGHLHKSIGLSHKSSALFGAPLVIREPSSAHSEISDCHVSSTQECTTTPGDDDSTSNTSSPVRKRRPSQIITARSDYETEEEEILPSQEIVEEKSNGDTNKVSESEGGPESFVSKAGTEPMESDVEVHNTTHVSTECTASNIFSSPQAPTVPFHPSPPLVTCASDQLSSNSDSEILRNPSDPPAGTGATVSSTEDPVLPETSESITVGSDHSKTELSQPVPSKDHSSNPEILTEVVIAEVDSQLPKESHRHNQHLNTESDLNKPVQAVPPSVPFAEKELVLSQGSQKEKKRKPGPASKTGKAVIKSTESQEPVTAVAVITSPSEPDQALSTSATLELATLKISIPSRPDQTSIVPMKLLSAGQCKNNKIWMYTPEHKLSLYGENQFVVDREHFKNYEDSSIPVWRIWKTRRLLQKFVPVEIDGRCFHQGLDEYRLFPEKEDDLFIKYQPIIFDVWIDTKSHQLGIYYNVIGSSPFLGYFPLTSHLLDDFKEFLQRMASRAMSDKVQRGSFTRKDDFYQDVINDHLKEIIEAGCFPQAFPIEILIQAIEYPRILNTRSGLKKNVACASCAKMGRSKPSHLKAVFDGDLYDHATFHLTKRQGHGKQSDFQFCRLCTKYLNAFHRIVHYKFWLFIAFRLQLRKLYSELKEGQRFHPDHVLKFLTGDFHFNKMCFYEFQAVYSEGYHSKDRLEREIKILGKKQKETLDSKLKQRSVDSPDLIKSFQKAIKAMFIKPRNLQPTQVTHNLCIEAPPLPPAKSRVQSHSNPTVASGRRKGKRKKLSDESGTMQQLGRTKLLGNDEPIDPPYKEVISRNDADISPGVDTSSTDVCMNAIGSRRVSVRKPTKRVAYSPEGKSVNSQLQTQREAGTSENQEVVNKGQKKKQCATSCATVLNKAMLKQSPQLASEPADSTSSSVSKRTQSNKRKHRPGVNQSRPNGSPPPSNVNLVGPPPKQRKKQLKSSRQFVKPLKESGKDVSSFSASASQDSEMDLVNETTKIISDLLEGFPHSNASPANASSELSRDQCQREGEDVFELLSIEFVS